MESSAVADDPREPAENRVASQEHSSTQSLDCGAEAGSFAIRNLTAALGAAGADLPDEADPGAILAPGTEPPAREDEGDSRVQEPSGEERERRPPEFLSP